jgi:hypothetical protein
MKKAILLLVLVACSAEETKRDTNAFGFDGSCVNCHAGLSAGHSHPNYKLKCTDCHGGNDQVAVPERAFETEAQYRDVVLMAQSHVVPKAKLARFFFANGLDDDKDGQIDETVEISGTTVVDFGEVFEPGLHGEGAGEFVDVELSRDLAYTRFLNPGDLRVATLGCGGANPAVNGSGCHQQNIDIVRRNIMVNQSAVINGAYYGNESWRTAFQQARGMEPDPRQGGFGYTLDYEGADKCILEPGTRTARFDSACLEARAAMQDPAVAANAIGNAGLPAFELAQGDLEPVITGDTTITVNGAGDLRLPWGGNPRTTDAVDIMKPVPNGDLAAGVPDPVDVILRTFRAYYPLNYPGSTNNFNFTFGTSILPDIARFRTANPYGRGHSSGCSACHAPYAYDGSRKPTRIRQDDGTFVDVVDPTTKHREFNESQDRGTIAGRDRLIGRAVSAQEQADTGRKQQRTYSANHAMTAKIDTDTCGLCHGFVTRINLAYQGMAEEEQRDQLARRKPIEFQTPGSKSTVRIVDSWVREDNISGNPVVVVPEGVEVIKKAKERDANLAAQGLVAGAGGCAQGVFSEDCNNNGELDTSLLLERVDEDGKVVASATINEDQNGNGKLDLIDRIPREKAVDGRQMRYVYGGRNGSTRLMDVHFERGMHCIDCHFLQDVHGDGHVYSTNWDAIEVECEDCHGTNQQRATLVTSGPNGGNDLTRALNDDKQPFFEKHGNTYVQRSRVTPGVFWKIPQTFDAQSTYAREAHSSNHIAGLDANQRGLGSEFAGSQGSSKLVSAKLDCHTCHSSWVLNCMGCHVDMNLGDTQRKKVAANGAITQSAAENEVWLSNNSNPAHVNFQLLGLLRSPFVLGVGGKSEGGRLMPFRSSMQVHLTVTGADGHTALDDMTFTTFQKLDASSGRMNVATSGVAMNQTMPHTVRPHEARGCETCHALVDNQGRVRNEHVLAQTYGLGSGSYSFVGDWAIAAGTNGIELFEHKQEKELAANLAGRSNRFPGLIVNPTTRTLAAIEPNLDGAFAGGTANDVVLIRNFNATPPIDGTTPPSLRDLAVFAVQAGGANAIVVTDITARGHPASGRQSINTAARTFILSGLPAPPLALAHISPDVSDPFVYAAVGNSGVSVIEIKQPPGVAGAATLVTTVATPGKTATDVALAGDMLYVGTQQGTIETFSLANPRLPVFKNSFTVGSPINDIAIAGFVMYVATPGGVGAIALDDPEKPAPPRGTGSAIALTGAARPANGLAIREGKVYFAGSAGVFVVDMRTPGVLETPASITTSAVNNPVDLVISGTLPGQTWVLVLEGNGSLVGIKLDNKLSTREKCFPNPKAQCKPLDMQLMDPTIMGRDPSVDANGNFDSAAVDPSAPPFFRITPAIINIGKRLARPAYWEAIGTLTGRRLRDSFMPGSGVLSLEVLQKMHDYEVCELEGQPSTNPSGLDALGKRENGQCVPFTGDGLSARQQAACRPAYFGGPMVCGPQLSPTLSRANPRAMANLGR